MESTSKERLSIHEYDNVPTVIINVRGTRFETFWSTVGNVPELLHTIRANETIKNGKGEYFFDRDPDVFKCLLNYCQLGELHVPITICGPVFAKEVQAWGITKLKRIEYCCLESINSSLMRLKNLKKFDDIFDDKSEKHPVATSKWERFRAYVWEILDHPSSSIFALIYSVLLFIIVMGSLFVFVTDTVDNPAFSIYTKKMTTLNVYTNKTTDNSTVIHNVVYDKRRTTHMNVLYFVTNIILTLDIIARFVFCKKVAPFLLNVYTIIDILSLIPFYFVIIQATIVSHGALNILAFSQSNSLIRLISLSIGLRCFRIIRHYKGMQVLIYTLKVSGYDLLLMMSIISLAVVLFSSLMFFAESNQPKTQFTNIPMCFWWCIVTITTLGYGDMVPATVLGYVIASFCALSGVLVIAFTVPVLVNNFVLYYTYATTNQRGSTIDFAKKHIKDAVDQVKKLKSKSPLVFPSLNNVNNVHNNNINSRNTLQLDSNNNIVLKSTNNPSPSSFPRATDTWHSANHRYKYSIDNTGFERATSQQISSNDTGNNHRNLFN